MAIGGFCPSPQGPAHVLRRRAGSAVLPALPPLWLVSPASPWGPLWCACRWPPWLSHHQFGIIVQQQCLRWPEESIPACRSSQTLVRRTLCSRRAPGGTAGAIPTAKRAEHLRAQVSFAASPAPAPWRYRRARRRHYAHSPFEVGGSIDLFSRYRPLPERLPSDGSLPSPCRIAKTAIVPPRCKPASASGNRMLQGTGRRGRPPYMFLCEWDETPMSVYAAERQLVPIVGDSCAQAIGGFSDRDGLSSPAIAKPAERRRCGGSDAWGQMYNSGDADRGDFVALYTNDSTFSARLPSYSSGS